MTKFGVCVKSFIGGISFGIGVKSFQIANEVKDIVIANQAVHQLSDPYGTIMIREMANFLPTIGVAGVAIAIALIASAACDLYHLLNKDKIES